MKAHRTRLATAAVCLLALAGCSDDADKEPADTSASRSPSPAAQTLDGLLEKSLALGGAHVEMALPATKGTGSGEVDFSSDAPEVDLTIKEPRQPRARLIVADGAMYAHQKNQNDDKFTMLDEESFDLSVYGLDPSEILEEVKTFKDGKDLGGGHFRFAEDDRAVDFYLGPDQLLQRMSLTGWLPRVEVTWTDWGKDVDIQAPPAARIMATPSASPSA
ncbi:MAG TPA: hypothetical protein VGE38_03610 [Nocardioides sp.]|uniref:hypothetical protein n=1 Tax=Nocardioides sp. TaxID=35761 RepID=UPI002EDB29AE